MGRSITSEEYASVCASAAYEKSKTLDARIAELEKRITELENKIKILENK